MNANSFLQQSLTPNDTFAITGLGAAIAVSVGTQIWLEVDFTDYAVTRRRSVRATGGWSGFPAPFVYTGTAPDQVLTTAFLLIGYVAAASSTLDGTVISGGPADAPVSGEDHPVRDAGCAAAQRLFQRAAGGFSLPASRALRLMKLTYFETGFFPFFVPAKDSSFASSAGAQTVYPAGFQLDQAMQIYWRAKDYLLVATGNGGLGRCDAGAGDRRESAAAECGGGHGRLRDADRLHADGAGRSGLRARDASGGAGFGDDHGERRAGSGTGAALFNLQVNLFYPEVYAPDPVVQYAGLWWPALSVSCQVTNTVALSGAARWSSSFDCTTLPDPESTTEIGTFTFFGVAVPVFCTALAPPSGPDPGRRGRFPGR